MRAFSLGDFLVNSSRVFTLQGGDIVLWSSLGNIDAGKGAKTALAVPPPIIVNNADGTTSVEYQGAATGSGIRVLLTGDAVPGEVDLIAPKGTVNAGDAGIGSAGNVNIAAQQVIGAQNINFSGYLDRRASGADRQPGSGFDWRQRAGCRCQQSGRR